MSLQKYTIIDLNFQGIPKAIGAFLVETSAGPLLIECGPHSTLKHLQKGLEEKGYAMEDIRHVFLSHIHLDHAGSAWYFARHGAKIYVHPKGYAHLAAPEKLMASARMIYRDKMDELWGEMNPIAEDCLIAVEDESTFQVGDVKLQAHYTPGHAVHHIAWQWEKILFTGDVGGVKIGDGPVMPPCPPPDINIEDWMTSIARIKRLNPDCLVLTHFGEVRNIVPHLDQLENQLTAWANWIKPHFETGTDLAIVTPLFQEYVASFLRNSGVDEQSLIKYEGANPAWMSVAGLMRYWKKKKAGQY